MKQIKCDLCGTVQSENPTPYGSGYKNITHTINMFSNYFSFYGDLKWELCQECGIHVRPMIIEFVHDLKEKMDLRMERAEALEGLPTHAERLVAQRKFEGEE